MNLRYLIRQNVSVIVVRSHSESPFSPPDHLHSGRIRDEMRQVAVRNQPCSDKSTHVMLVKDASHNRPESFLPLENGLFGDYMRHDVGVEAALEKVMGQLRHIIQRVMIAEENQNQMRLNQKVRIRALT